MKYWIYWVLLLTALVLIFTGCTQQPGEEILPDEEVGGDELNQAFERVQALGTQLDKQPAQTEKATFALG